VVPGASRRISTACAARGFAGSHALTAGSFRVGAYYGKYRYSKREILIFSPPHFCEIFRDSGRILRLQNPFKYTRNFNLNHNRAANIPYTCAIRSAESMTYFLLSALNASSKRIC